MATVPGEWTPILSPEGTSRPSASLPTAVPIETASTTNSAVAASQTRGPRTKSPGASRLRRQPTKRNQGPTAKITTEVQLRDRPPGPSKIRRNHLVLMPVINAPAVQQLNAEVISRSETDPTRQGYLDAMLEVAEFIPEMRKGLTAQEPSGAGRHRQEWERAMAALDATDAITMPCQQGG